ncbi:pilus assembly FimT family protein [Anoxybacillus sp. J5B_2022]|uniref:pilus assembly FimT family protein n=1 Tax=Anoxybacillus sp. J5B_2022 TaxID=3003246 RepID=UPI002286C227|nr:type II secretion system protein [Anoxybacillus sp. J5B_2022]MCZ0756676.1 type II secretion system protein [Anoxybacillus sp. J5B_2022]
MLPRMNRGMTLFELLAVIAILGIVASIAVIIVTNVIEKMRMQAFVSDAYAMYEAARLHVGAEKVEFLAPRSAETLTYKQLVEDGVLEPIKDPFTGNVLSTETNPSYVLIKKDENGRLDYFICLKGETKQLCSYSDTQAEVPVEQLSISLIKDIR